MARWVVIGAGSFSGGAFMRHLAEAGETAWGMYRPTYDLVRSIDAMLERLEALRPDYIVNFAALNMVAESWTHYADYYRTNVIGVADLAEGLVGKPWLSKFVQVSTPEVYGGGAAQGFLREDAPFRPSTPYAVSRAAADLHLAALHAAKGFPVAFTRTVNVYGPGQQLYRIIPKTVLSILRGEKLVLDGGGRSTRSFIHIRDVARGIEAVAREAAAGTTWHMATREQTSIRGLVGHICALMGVAFEDAVVEGPERLGKDMAYRLDDAAIRERLAWRDVMPFERGVAETVAWFRSRDFAGRALRYEHRA